MSVLASHAGHLDVHEPIGKYLFIRTVTTMANQPSSQIPYFYTLPKPDKYSISNADANRDITHPLKCEFPSLIQRISLIWSC